jgi:hypothetical protein
LFLSRTATEEPGSARENVALEPSSKSILELGLGLIDAFYFTAWRYRCGSGSLDLHARLIVEQNQNTSWVDVTALMVRPAITFVSFWFLRTIY